MWCVWTKAGEFASPVPVLTTDDERTALARYEVERTIVRSGRQSGEVYLTHRDQTIARYTEIWNPPHG